MFDAFTVKEDSLTQTGITATRTRIFPCSFRDKLGRMVDVRLLRPGDAAHLHAMYDTFHPKGQAQGLPPINDEPRHQWLNGILETGVHALAWVGGRIAGHVVLFDINGAMSEWGIFIHQDFQGAGIGRRLTELGGTWAAELGYKGVWLVVERSNRRAANVFRRCGYAPLGAMESELEMKMFVDPYLRRLVRGELPRPSREDFVSMTRDIIPIPETDFSDAVLIHSEFIREDAAWGRSAFIAERSYLPVCRCRRMGLLPAPEKSVFLAPPVNFQIASYIHTPEYLLHLHLAGLGMAADGAAGRGVHPEEGATFLKVDRFALGCSGASLLAARLLKRTSARVVFNPCGGFHHALPDRASNFCFINDTAIAVSYLLDSGLKVFYLSLDPAGSRALQALFQNHPGFLGCSLHADPAINKPENPLLSGILSSLKSKRFHDIILPHDVTDHGYAEIFDDVIAGIARKFKPDVCVLQLGVEILNPSFSPHIRLTRDGFSNIISRAAKLAGRTLILGGCGQDADLLSEGLSLVWRQFTPTNCLIDS